MAVGFRDAPVLNSARPFDSSRRLAWRLSGAGVGDTGRTGSYLLSPDPTASSEPAVIPLQVVEQIVGSVVEMRRWAG